MKKYVCELQAAGAFRSSPIQMITARPSPPSARRSNGFSALLSFLRDEHEHRLEFLGLLLRRELEEELLRVPNGVVREILWG